MHIDKDSYKISPDNRYKNKTAKTQLVIGTSLRKDHNHLIRLKHKDYGMTKKWNTFTIGRDGVIYQHYDDKYHTDFLGVKKGDLHSISIVLENMGALFENKEKKHVNWLNEICDPKMVVEKEWLGYEFWEEFPEEQIDALIELCDKLCSTYNIPKQFIEFNSYHKEVYKFRGIAFRSNFIDESSDMTPLLDIEKLNNKLIKEKN